MATEGTDSGGNFTIVTDEEQVLALLRGLPSPPTGDALWSCALNGEKVGGQDDPNHMLVAAGFDKQTATAFGVDPTTYRKALQIAGHSTWEAGNPSGHRAARNAPDPSAREF